MPDAPNRRAPRRQRGVLEWVLDGNGNSTALTPRLARCLLTAHRSGDWPQMTALKCGLDPRSLKTYIDRGLEPYAVEPYAGFATEFLRIEAAFSQDLLDVVIDAALGRRPRVRLDEKGLPLPRPSVAEAKWLLQTRFAVLWGGGGISAIAMFSPENDPVRRQKAMAVLASMNEEQKAAAKSAGFMLPKSGPQLPRTTTGPVTSVAMARTGPDRLSPGNRSSPR